MKTSSFFTHQGVGRISISVSAPKGQSGFKSYPALAPDRAWLKMGRAQYEPLYMAKLAKLDPQKVWGDLTALADGEEPILLCWETLIKQGEWCHRRMAAAWLEQHLGHEVLEYGTKSTKEKEQPRLF